MIQSRSNLHRTHKWKWLLSRTLRHNAKLLTIRHKFRLSCPSVTESPKEPANMKENVLACALNLVCDHLKSQAKWRDISHLSTTHAILCTALKRHRQNNNLRLSDIYLNKVICGRKIPINIFSYSEDKTLQTPLRTSRDLWCDWLGPTTLCFLKL